MTLCPLTGSTFTVTSSYGTRAGARSQHDIAGCLRAPGAPQCELPAPVDCADRQRDRRLVLFFGDLQLAVAVHRPGAFGGPGAGFAGHSPDFVRPLSGVVNDRIRRKRVMIASDLLRVVIVFSMLFVRSRSMVWLVYPLLFLESVMWAFFEPARTAVIPNITTSEDLILANTLSSTTW